MERTKDQKSKISARVICDSVSNAGARITTMVLTYPRLIHSELMTHRRFSRNASSSRAIPIQKMISRVWYDPAYPVQFGKNGKGMQAVGETKWASVARIVWLLAARTACVFAWILWKLDVHKQVANRVLEPFAWMTTIVTSTEWENFFRQRLQIGAERGVPLADPTFFELAWEMRQALMASVPVRREHHRPFLSPLDERYSDELKELISAARSARVSYLNHEGKRSVPDDLRLAGDLKKAPHLSPAEHVAEAMAVIAPCRNFDGWIQLRVRWEEEAGW